MAVSQDFPRQLREVQQPKPFEIVFGLDIRRHTRRLWPQTEIAKAWIAQTEAGEAGAAEQAHAALARLERYYLRHPIAGGWFDQFDREAGRWSQPFRRLRSITCCAQRWKRPASSARPHGLIGKLRNRADATPGRYTWIGSEICARSFAMSSSLSLFKNIQRRAALDEVCVRKFPIMGRRAREVFRSAWITLLITVATLAAIEGLLRVADFRVLREGASERSLTYRYDAELGWVPIPNSSSVITTARTIHVRHNSLGFRDVEFESDARPKMLFIGTLLSGASMPRPMNVSPTY